MTAPYFRARFGDFAVDPPLSDAMQAFLRKIEPAVPPHHSVTATQLQP